MTQDHQVSRRKTPWHLWVVGLVTVLWNGMGLLDYYMTQSRNAEYLKGFTAEQLAYFENFPSWVQGSWGLAVTTAFVGSVLLLFRSRFALPVFWVSLFAMILTTIHNWIIDYDQAIKMMGGFGIVFSMIIAVVAVLLVIYSRRAVATGVLR
jgi:hypothetical protein